MEAHEARRLAEANLDTEYSKAVRWVKNVKKELLEEALYALIMHNTEMKRMGDSGDAGFWEVEEQEEWITAQKVIVKLQEILK